MDTTTLDFNTLALMVAILGSTMGSTLTLVTLIIRQSNRHEDSIRALDAKFTGMIGDLDAKFTGMIGDLDAKFTGRIGDLDTKFTGMIDRLARDVSDTRERVARIEGHLMAPGEFRIRGLDTPAPGEPSPDNPDPDHRAAG